MNSHFYMFAIEKYFVKVTVLSYLKSTVISVIHFVEVNYFYVLDILQLLSDIKWDFTLYFAHVMD